VTLMELSSLQTGLLLLAPAILLGLILLLGRYPGEELLARSPRMRLRQRRRVAKRRIRPAPVRRVAGGLLVGCALAGRAPPSVA
jgi:hypothetical protein